MSVCPLRYVYPVVLPPGPFAPPRPVVHGYTLRSRIGNGSLIGFSGYDDGTFDPEDPTAWTGHAKKWRKRAVSISQEELQTITTYTGNDCTGAVLTVDPRPFSLLGDYVAKYTKAGVPSVRGTVAQDNMGSLTTFTPALSDSARDFTAANASNFQFIDGIPYGTSYAGIIPIQPGTYATTLTTERLALAFDLTVCNGGGYRVAHAQAILCTGTLFEPDTFFDALTRSGGVLGTADTTQPGVIDPTTPASAAPLSFSAGTAVRVSGVADNVTRLRPYVLTVTLETESLSAPGTFGPLVEIVNLTPTSSRLTYDYDVPIFPGYATRFLSAVLTSL